MITIFIELQEHTSIRLHTRLFTYFRALEGHTNGDLPWAWCDEGLDDQMATIVGKFFV